MGAKTAFPRAWLTNPTAERCPIKFQEDVKIYRRTAYHDPISLLCEKSAFS